MWTGIIQFLLWRDQKKARARALQSPPPGSAVEDADDKYPSPLESPVEVSKA
jgi:hypothetical protein